jgi:hypothetical protein
MKITKACLIIILILFSTLIIADPPNSIDKIPVMPGASYSADYTQIVYNSAWGSYRAELFELDFIDTKRKGYITESTFDQIVKYYKNELDAEQSDYLPNLEDFSKMKNNSPAFMQYEYLGFHVIFTWIYKVNEREAYKFFVTANKEMDYTAEGGNSSFYFIQNKYAKEISKNSPTAVELGAPLYPNLEYLPGQSIKSGRINDQVFLTGDPIEDILNFYETKLKKKAYLDDYGDYGFINYNNNNYDDFITIKRMETGEILITYHLSQR